MANTIQVLVELPVEILSALRQDPEQFVREMRLAAAVKWYELELISQSKAAEVAGISRTEFLDALRRFQVTPFQVTTEEPLAELENDGIAPSCQTAGTQPRVSLRGLWRGQELSAEEIDQARQEAWQNVPRED